MAARLNPSGDRRFVLRRVVSGGQTGVDRAALDAALQLGIPCGGWCPRGRVAEDGRIPAAYPLVETPTAEYAERTEWNVRDSDATLLLTWGELAGGTRFTRFVAQKWNRPHTIVDMSADPSVVAVRRWLDDRAPSTLNIAGPRASLGPHVYPDALGFLSEVLFPYRSNA